MRIGRDRGRMPFSDINSSTHCHLTLSRDGKGNYGLTHATRPQEDIKWHHQAEPHTKCSETPASGSKRSWLIKLYCWQCEWCRLREGRKREREAKENRSSRGDCWCYRDLKSIPKMFTTDGHTAARIPNFMFSYRDQSCMIPLGLKFLTTVSISLSLRRRSPEFSFVLFDGCRFLPGITWTSGSPLCLWVQVHTGESGREKWKARERERTGREKNKGKRGWGEGVQRVEEGRERRRRGSPEKGRKHTQTRTHTHEIHTHTYNAFHTHTPYPYTPTLFQRSYCAPRPLQKKPKAIAPADNRWAPIATGQKDSHTCTSGTHTLWIPGTFELVIYW